MVKFSVASSSIGRGIAKGPSHVALQATKEAAFASARSRISVGAH